VAVLKTERWRSRELNGGGHGICPRVLWAATGQGVQFNGLTPLPASAWVSRTESPLVWQTWAWCSSRSTVAVASVLGVSSSKPTGVGSCSSRWREDVGACGFGVPAIAYWLAICKVLW